MSELTNLFTAIADSIREKTGESETITACDFPNRITELQTFDTSLIATWNSLFSGNTELIYAPFLVNSGFVKSCRSMFTSCTNMIECNQFYDFSNITDASYMFSGCSNLTIVSVPLSFTSSLTTVSRLFQNCTKLTEIAGIEMADCGAGKVDCSDIFRGCGFLTKICDETVEELDFNCAKNTCNMFYGCKSLTCLPNLLLANTANINDIFYNCESLVDLGGLTDLGNAFTSTTASYSNYTLDLSTCTSLSGDSFVNIANTIGTPVATQLIKITRTQSDMLSSEGKYTDFLSLVQGKNWTVSIQE